MTIIAPERLSTEWMVEPLKVKKSKSNQLVSLVYFVLNYFS